MAPSSSIRLLFVIVFHVVFISKCGAFNCAADIGDAKSKCRHHEEELRAVRYGSVVEMDDLIKFCGSASDWLSCMESRMEFVTSCTKENSFYENLNKKINDTKEKNDKFCAGDKPKEDLSEVCLISKAYHVHAKCEDKIKLYEIYVTSQNGTIDENKVKICRSLSDVIGCYKDLKGKVNKCEDGDKAARIVDRFIHRDTKSLKKQCEGVDYGQNVAGGQHMPLIPLLPLCIYYLNR